MNATYCCIVWFFICCVRFLLLFSYSHHVPSIVRFVYIYFFFSFIQLYYYFIIDFTLKFAAYIANWINWKIHLSWFYLELSDRGGERARENPMIIFLFLPAVKLSEIEQKFSYLLAIFHNEHSKFLWRTELYPASAASLTRDMIVMHQCQCVGSHLQSSFLTRRASMGFWFFTRYWPWTISWLEWSTQSKWEFIDWPNAVVRNLKKNRRYFRVQNGLSLPFIYCLSVFDDDDF